MGRAVVVESLGNAAYVVDIIRDSPEVRAFVDVQLEAAQAIADTLPDLLTAATIAETEMNAARQKYESDQAAMETGEVSAFLQDYLSTFAVYEAARSNYLTAKMRATEMEVRAAAKLETLQPRRAEAWCATYTRLSVGQTVATIEVGHQASRSPYTIIAPLGREPVAADGILRDVMSMTPAQAYLNYALLPGTVQWRRRYSVGTVTDTDLENEQLLLSLWVFNSAGFYIHEDPDVLWLPYIKRCIGGERCEFHVGDQALIEHHPTTFQPQQVIGWAEWPRPCLGMHLRSFTLTEGWRRDYDNYPPLPDDGDWHFLSSQSIWVFNPYFTPDQDVGTIDGVKLVKGSSWSNLNPPDPPQDGSSYFYYGQYRMYPSLDGYTNNVPEIIEQWEAAHNSGEFLLCCSVDGLHSKYFHVGDYEITLEHIAAVKNRLPTDFSIIQRFFGDGDVRSIKAEWPPGTDPLNFIRATGSTAYTNSISLGSKAARLTSDYAFELLETYINTHILSRDDIAWTSTDSSYATWEEFIQGLRNREVAIVVTSVRNDVSIALQNELMSVTVDVYELEDVI